MPVGRVAPGGGRAAATPVSTPAKLPLGTPGTREINSCTANNPLQLPSGGQFPWGRVPVPFLVPVRADGPVHLIACSILASTWLLHSNPSGRRGVQEPGEERRSRAWREEYRILEKRGDQDPGEEENPGSWRREESRSLEKRSGSWPPLSTEVLPWVGHDGSTGRVLSPTLRWPLPDLSQELFQLQTQPLPKPWQLPRQEIEQHLRGGSQAAAPGRLLPAPPRSIAVPCQGRQKNLSNLVQRNAWPGVVPSRGPCL